MTRSGGDGGKSSKPVKAESVLWRFFRWCRNIFLFLACVAGAFWGVFKVWQQQDSLVGSTYFKSRPGSALSLYIRPLATLPLLSWEESEAKADEILKHMTNKERHALMKGVGWKAEIAMASVNRGWYMGNTPPIPRLLIPALKMHDAGNGFRVNPTADGSHEPFGTVTCWPSALALAATWNEDTVQATATAIGKEFRGKGANVILGPAVQVHRVAKNGRNFEYMSGEDPYLGSRLGAAYVRGVQSVNVMAVVKHWAFNEQETDRMNQSSNVDERTAWELYYPPFEAALAAGAASVMCSYNRVNGSHACNSETLLKRDLKGRIGFRGFIMSDWWALHRTAVKEGLDQEMPGVGAGWLMFRHGPFMTHEKIEAVETDTPEAGFIGRALNQLTGDDSRAHIPRDKEDTEPARRILAAMLRLRLFELPGCDPGVDCMPAMNSEQRSFEHGELAKFAAMEATVLLQNDGILPLRPGNGIKKVALVGEALTALPRYKGEGLDFMPPADYYAGGGSGHVAAGDTLVTPLEGITARAAMAGIEVKLSPSSDVGAATFMAQDVDAVIVVAATSAMEQYDRATLNLDGRADAIVEAVSKLKPTIVLVQAPGTFLAPWRESVSAIAVQFMGGERTGSAWAGLLFGDFNPSAKLPIMLPKTEEGTIPPSPARENYYSEGLFTSYRQRNAAELSAFAFGHGLSFTEFMYGEAEQLPKKDCLPPFVACVKTTVTNVGRTGYAGSEVAQAYVEFSPAVEAPKLMLKGFHKTKPLEVNDSEIVHFNFTARDMSTYLSGGWRLQEQATLHIGASSVDLRRTLVITADKSQAQGGCVAPWALRPI